jgi:hypothetical protein
MHFFYNTPGGRAELIAFGFALSLLAGFVAGRRTMRRGLGYALLFSILLFLMGSGITSAIVYFEIINNTRMCDQFSGADYAAKINACLADLPAAGGIADATGIVGVQTSATSVTLLTNTVTKLGAITIGYSGAGDAFSCTTDSSATTPCHHVILQGSGKWTTTIAQTTGTTGTSVVHFKWASHYSLRDMTLLATKNGGGVNSGESTAGTLFDEQSLDGNYSDIIVWGNLTTDVSGECALCVLGSSYGHHRDLVIAGGDNALQIKATSTAIPAAVQTAIGFSSGLKDGNTPQANHWVDVQTRQAFKAGLGIISDVASQSIIDTEFVNLTSLLNGLANASTNDEAGVYVRGQLTRTVTNLSIVGGATYSNNMHGIYLDGAVARGLITGVRSYQNGSTATTGYQLALANGSVSGAPNGMTIDMALEATGTGTNQAFLDDSSAQGNHLNLNVLTYTYTISNSADDITLTTANSVYHQTPASAILTLGTATIIAATTGDFTTAASTSLQAITGLSVTLPANTAVKVPFSCHLAYSQATAAVTVAFGIQDVTVAPTNIFATGSQQTNTTAFTGATLATLSTTTATNIVSATPSATATIYKVDLAGYVEQPSNASSSVLQIMVSTSNSADLVTVKRGSNCTFF